MIPEATSLAQNRQDAKVTILLVEDDSAVRWAVQTILEMRGYYVLQADGPKSAIEIASDTDIKFDLLVTDLLMPGMNGIELARRVREIRPGLKTLYMTGYCNGEFLNESGSTRSQVQIQKPFSSGALLACVAEALRETVPQRMPQCNLALMCNN